MTVHICDKCKKEFQRVAHLDYHIKHDACKKHNSFCKYCNKGFTSNISRNRHMRLYCKVRKHEEEKKLDILNRLILLEEKNKTLEEKNKVLENEINKIKNKKTNNVITTTNNNAINNGTVINNHINLVAYGREDMSKIDTKEILKVLRKGYDSTLRLTETVHFNPKYPEYHNVYITNMKDKYAMMYDGKSWNLTIKEDLINRLYDDKKDYIEANVEDFVNFLTKSQKNALDRWANTDEEDNKIKRLKERIKLLLYNSRDVPINTQKHIDNYKVLVARKGANGENVLQEVV